MHIYEGSTTTKVQKRKEILWVAAVTQLGVLGVNQDLKLGGLTPENMFLLAVLNFMVCWG